MFKKKFLKYGYRGETILDSTSLEVIKKYFNRDNFIYRSKFDSKFLFENEINSVKNLSKVSNKYVQTPVIISINENELEWRQKFFKGTNFYKYLLFNCNKLYFNKLLLKQFYELGRYLGKFHDSNLIKINKKIPISEIHGDLSSHNIMFLENNKLFIFDPGVSQKSIYKDLAKFLLNLKFFNPFYWLILSKNKLKLIEKEFLKGYNKEISYFNLDRRLLKEEILFQLKTDRHYFSKNISYVFKKFLMNQYNKIIYCKIKKSKNI